MPHRIDPPILLVMVPGMGMVPEDFDVQGLIPSLHRHCWPVTIATVDPGPDAYLDGSVEARLLNGITQARHTAGTDRIWLAGISLGCQAILRFVRMQPGLVEGMILLTPYLASTGLIAEVSQASGLRQWAASNSARWEPERALLTWLARTSFADLPHIFVGRALDDRFAATATLLADLLPPNRTTTVPGKHEWASWRELWHLILEQKPFEQKPAVSS